MGDFHRGSITSITARCGKLNWRCHQLGHPGHGPNFRLTRKIQGKTVSETFSSPAALRKAQREVAEFHKFQALSQTLVEVNEKICPLRPVEEEEPSEQGKNGGSDPSRDRAGSRPALAGRFPGSAQDGRLDLEDTAEGVARDGQIAETGHSMNGTERAFRLIVLRGLNPHRVSWRPAGTVLRR